jgi:hypothetical protein
MIGGQRVKAGLDIGEVLLEKAGHIRVEAASVRYWGISAGSWPGFVTISPPRRLG